MSLAELRNLSSSDAMAPEKAAKPEENDSLDKLVGQTLGREPFISFSRAGDSPIHWIHLLNTLDHQGNNKVSKGTTAGNWEGGRSLDHRNGVRSLTSNMNAVKESTSSVASSRDTIKMTNSASEGLQSLKIPEAVVAYAETAAKANGEPEKCFPGWPLLSPSKLPLQKCEKCSREFCSPVNYRRHVRVHRRSLNVEKVSPRNREVLGSFWDKLPLDERKELVLSLQNLTLEEITGSSIIKALTSLVRKPGFSCLPQVYAKAGAILLDVIQANPSWIHISSQELFGELDDASEKTFMCAGTAVSLQKFVFDGKVGKVALDMKNVIACTSFLFEQKLVKTWLADKDAEALRCQKLLIEEEEAAQKKQAELLEKRRLKKLRQKMQKATEHCEGGKPDFKEGSPDIIESPSCSTEMPSPNASSGHGLDTPAAPLDSTLPSLASAKLSGTDAEADVTCLVEGGDSDLRNDNRVQHESGQVQVIVSQQLKSRNGMGGFHPSPIPFTKSIVMRKHFSFKDPKATTVVNGQMIWTRKTKPEGEVISNSRDRMEKETNERSDRYDNPAVLIGSISVSLGESNSQCAGSSNLQEKEAKLDCDLNGLNRAAVKQWRPVSRQGAGNSSTIQLLHEDTSLILPHDRMGNNMSETTKDSKAKIGSTDLSAPQLFSSQVAEAFLSQRWKEAIASDHVKIGQSPTESMYHFNVPEAPCMEDKRQLPDCSGRSILGSAENRMVMAGSVDPASTGFHKPVKPEKTYRIKYMPKQKNNLLER